MVIHNFSKQYRVIREWEGEGAILQYVCREETEQKDYRIARQELKRVSGNEIRFFMEQLHNESFKDFIDYFTDAQSLYLVMAHPAGESLTEKMQESCSLKERMEIGKNLLEHIVLFNLPAFFFKAAMNPELIMVSRALEISLGYDLSYLGEFEENTFSEACILLGQIFGELYKAEISIRAFSPMEVFIQDLKDKKFATVLEIYKRFQGIYEEWADKKVEELKPDSFAFRFWGWVKKLGRFLKKLVAVAILLIAVVYLAFSIREAMRMPDQYNNYSMIGTLKIQDNTQDESLPSAETGSVGE